MTILGISLLRLGDLILQRPLIEGLRRQHPQCEIHLLINKQFSQAEFLFEGLVDRFIYFDREQLQRSCGEKEFSIFWGLQNLKNLLTELNRVDYEYVYNFTHNRLTAHIAGLVRSKRKVGIYSENGQFHGLNNPWIQFFNNFFGRPEATGFHYTEILAKALEIPLKSASSKSSASAARRKVLIQPLTSDLKKNWHPLKFIELQKRIGEETGCEVLILGAPFEAEYLSKYFSEAQLAICDLEAVAVHLRETALLITGDTSVKHLAALYEVPILELSLGSSQPLQVGAYSNQSIILQTKVACGPCPHSQPCSQETRVCEERLATSIVLQAAKMALCLTAESWESFALSNPDLNVYRTQILHNVGWTIECLSVAQKNNFDEILQRKMMIVEELDRRHLAQSKGVLNEQRTRKLSDSGVEAP